MLTKERSPSIPFVDLKAQQKRILPSIENRIKDVLNHGQYIMGPEIRELEEQLMELTDTKYCISVASGTDALLMSLMALGIGRGDEVITTPFSFFATAETISLLGANVVYVDIDSRTYNIDASLIEPAITKKTKAVIPVSLYGQCSDMDPINEIANQHNLAVIEDGAQSLGATYKGKMSCGLSTIGCTSFFPSKPLGAYGDGGACFTDDRALATALKEIRVHGQSKRYTHTRIGINGRLDTLQAAILLAKLEVFLDETKSREQIGKEYTQMIAEKCPNVIPPFIESHNTSVYAQFTVQVDDRPQTQAKLNENGIPTAIHYPIPLNQQLGLQQDGSFPISTQVAKRVLSLPMHPYLQEQDMKYIVKTLQSN